MPYLCFRSLATTVLATVLLSVSSAGICAQDSLLTPVSVLDPKIEAWEQVQRDIDPAISRSGFGVLAAERLREVGGVRDLPAVFELDLLGASHLVRFDAFERGVGHIILRGSVDAGGSIVLALGAGGHAAASIEIGDASYALRATGVAAIHAVHALDGSAQHAHAKSCGTDHQHAVHSPVDGSAPMAASAATTPIDVCVFYTPSARTQAGGHGPIRSQIAMRLGVATQGSSDSSVTHKYRLAHAAETNYTETGTSTDLSRFRSTNDGFMDEVHALRDTFGGDLMALIISTSSQFCGIGYLMTNPSTGFRSSAFSVSVRSCLSNHTLTHEMGHTMGCSHDRQNGGRGAYSYSYGYRSVNNVYRTIMAYSPGSRVNKWSGPNVTESGFVLGTASDDNARSLNNVANIVASFKPKTVYDWELLGGRALGFLFGPNISFTGTTNRVVPIRVRIDQTLPGAPGVLVVGTSTVNLPFFGATLVPNIGVSLPIAGSPEGILLNLPQMTALSSGTDVFFQGFFLDAFARQGLSATEGMRVSVP